MSEEPQSIAVAVVRREGTVLAGPRPADKPLAGLWEFPGGKVRPGEPFEEAAERECREETGLAIEVVGLLCQVEHEYAHGPVSLRFFDCRLTETGAEPRSPFRWVALAELELLEFPEANSRVIKMLLASGERGT